MSRLPPFLEALRPHQWIKNLLVFPALVFAGQLGDSGQVLRASLAFLVFCCVSSGHYLVNDLVDLERDRLHPEKRNRPLASGRLSPAAGKLGAVVLLLGGLLFAHLIGPASLPVSFACWPCAYLVLNFFYSYRFKHVVVLDVMCISLGFLIRVHAGGAVLGKQASHWLILCTFFAALMLAVCKRRAELSLLGEESAGHRKALRDYSIEYLDQLIAPLGAMTVFSYACYTVAPETRERLQLARLNPENLYLTVPFVVFGIFRYLFLVHRRERGGDPARVLLTDQPTLLNIGLWFVAAVGLLYGGR